jgi:lysophosphatidylcholine acyltransferase / lyso-PAF acetyltransferase
VKRENYNSRYQTVHDIMERVKQPELWPQIFIYPEGTCSNGQSLIEFKTGAFNPGQSVQPVIVRYPNKIDTVSEKEIDSIYNIFTMKLFLSLFSIHGLGLDQV